MARHRFHDKIVRTYDTSKDYTTTYTALSQYKSHVMQTFPAQIGRDADAIGSNLVPGRAGSRRAVARHRFRYHFFCRPGFGFGFERRSISNGNLENLLCHRYSLIFNLRSRMTDGNSSKPGANQDKLRNCPHHSYTSFAGLV